MPLVNAYWGDKMDKQLEPEFAPWNPQWRRRSHSQKLSSDLHIGSVACLHLQAHVYTHTHTEYIYTYIYIHTYIYTHQKRNSTYYLS